mmetsp:Transcript_11617/g.17741  ORF Transcript_11617/g.17741 Transcript_11617/m.17741 type:complete len:103 (-) Transcript_11617:21-329(-)
MSDNDSPSDHTGMPIDKFKSMGNIQKPLRHAKSASPTERKHRLIDYQKQRLSSHPHTKLLNNTAHNRNIQQNHTANPKQSTTTAIQTMEHDPPDPRNRHTST